MRALAFVSMAMLGGSAFADTGCHEAIVSNEASGDLTVVDPRAAAVVATIPVGKRPRGMAVSHDGRSLYVALSGTPPAGPGVDESTLPPADKQADGIGVVNLDSRKLERVIRGVSDPERAALSADGQRLFVASEDEGLVMMFDIASGRVLARTPVGDEAEGVDPSPDGQLVFATAEAAQRVTVLNASTAESLARIEVGIRPRSTSFSPDGAFAYVANEAGASISVIDTRQRQVVRTLALPAGKLPMRIAVPPSGSPLYVSTGRGREILAIDARDGRIVARAESGARPWDVAIDAHGSELYAANGPSNDLSIFTLPALRLRARVHTGEKPWGVVCRRQAH